jgi:secreted trypsin-like serine protease
LYEGKASQWVHDIALLRLSTSLQFNAHVRSICLPNKDFIVQQGDRTVVTGWGETQGTGNFQYLREVDVPIQSNEQCQLPDISWSTSLCGGLCTNSTCDACQVRTTKVHIVSIHVFYIYTLTCFNLLIIQGDSGGPMIFLHNDQWQLVGLISWGFSCAGLGVYTKISYYTDWIQQWIIQ